MAMISVLENCWVVPPPGTTVPEKSLPLTFYDLPWLQFPPVQRLFFYAFAKDQQISTQEAIISSLKNSLSLTLKRFYMLAGHLTFPPDSYLPAIRYVEGDSVSLIFATSTQDFHYLTSDSPRKAFEFHHLVPELQETKTTSLLAIQVTFFPGWGFCVGLSIRHESGDGNALIRFIKSWATTTKLTEDDSEAFYDRSIIKDSKGMGQTLWNKYGAGRFDGSAKPDQLIPTNKVRSTFVISRADIQRLKRHVSSNCPTVSQVSAFTVTCAVVWASVVRAGSSIPEITKDESAMEHFVFPADCRALLDPPVPQSYFGNCVVPCFISIKRCELIRKDGFLVAAKLMGEAITERLKSKEGLSKCMEEWISKLGDLVHGSIMGVAGSPKYRIYDMDFGWGKPKTSEIVSIDLTGAMSLNECKDGVEGDLEVGLSLEEVKMHKFANVFTECLRALENGK
ncbi:hypothetical protein RJ641_015397 [Dillenia turbinata]|uniref:Uncharacterized protein n=1 Tax=Dillenia turbinata TaxID=194707 RepID=A0AAN8UM85_9MAGN